MERNGGYTPEEQAYLEERRAEIRNLVAAKDTEGIKQFLKRSDNAENASKVRHDLDELVRKARTNERQAAGYVPTGKANEVGSMKNKYDTTLAYTKEIVDAFKQDPTLIPAAPDTPGGRLVRNLVSNIDSVDQIDQFGAPYLYKVLDHSVNKTDVDPLTLLSAEELNNLRNLSPTIYNKLLPAIKTAARESGKSDQEIATLEQSIQAAEERANNESQRRGRRERGTPQDDWEQHYKSFLEPEDLPLVEALYSPEGFANYLEKVRNEISSSGITDNVELTRRTGEEVERNIVVLFSKFYQKVDTDRPTEIFEKITQVGGYLKSIEVATETLKRQLEGLAVSIERGENVPDSIKNMRLFERETDKVVGTKTVQVGEHKVEREVTQFRMVPVPGMKETSVSHFLHRVATLVDREKDAREYLHNIRASYLRPAGKDGFWPQLASYAEKLGATDIDGLMLLPDSDLFMAATRLYTKYIEEDFAVHNWIHQPNQFSADMSKNQNKFEDKVLEDLHKMFGTDKEGKNIDEWRLRRAVNMGVGLARGVFLTEAEMAAWAEPQVDQKGNPTYKSYYTNDNATLAPLNPLHHFYRWQAQDVVMGPLLFMPVNKLKGNFAKWEHRELWEKMHKWKEAFVLGKNVRDNKDEELFVDILPNLGQVGSFITRGGWRMGPAYHGWITGVESNGKITDLPVDKGWKALEGIGFEALIHYVGNEMKGDFLTKKSMATERDTFFQYLYGKYINPSLHGNDAGLRDAIDADVRYLKEERKKSAKKPAEKTDEALTEYAYQRLGYRALAGVMRDRMPTKMVRIDRDRFTNNGNRAWKKLQIEMKMTPDQFDNVMRNIMLVETKVRQVATDQMKNHLKGKPDDKMTLYDLDIKDYVVNDTTIDAYLKGEGITDEDRIKAKELLTAIHKECYSGEKLTALGKKFEHRGSNFPFALGTEELETTFLSYRNSGERVLARALGDTGHVETNVFGPLKEWLGALRSVAVDEKHDVSPLITSIAKMRTELVGIHGMELGNKIAHHMATMTIAFFMQDAHARNLIGPLFGMGKKHSLAAEFVGTGREVWEWDVSDADKFIVALERKGVLPKEGYDLKTEKSHTKEDIVAEQKPVQITIPFTGKKITVIPGFKVKFGEKARDPDNQWSSHNLRKDMGVQWGNNFKEIMSKYAIIAIIALLYKFISDSLKEAEGGKK